MPLYEYKCSNCRFRFTVLLRTWDGVPESECPKCGSRDAERVMSTFAYHRSLHDVHEQSGEASLEAGPEFYKDPRNIGRWTEKKFNDMGIDVPSEIREEIDAARDGQLPESLTD